MSITAIARSAPAVRIALALIILVSSLLAATSWRVYSHTWDEPEHLAAGVELLDLGRYEYDTEHPPIARALMAVGPYLAGAHSFGTPPPDGVQEGIDILYGSGHYDLYLALARLGTLPFLAMLLLATWLWARRIASTSHEALLAVVLVATVPPLLGHAALATLDVPGAATTLLALYALQQWITSASVRDALVLGGAAGLAMGTKFSAIPFLGLGLIVLAAVQWLLSAPRPQGQGPGMRSPGHGWSTSLAGLGSAFIAAAVPIALAYGLRSDDPNGVARRFNWAVAYLFRDHGWVHDTACALAAQVWLPEAFKAFVEGVVALKAHNDTGHVSFLLGHVQANGWWYFYLVALAVKTPLPLLIAGPIGMGMLAYEGWRDKDSWRVAPALLFLALLAFASLFSHINIGIRHVLVLYPFLALGGAYALVRAWRALRAVHSRYWAGIGKVLIVGLVGWQVSTLWTANPDYLPYFNETVTHPDQVLVDSDLDWGQDLHRLEHRLLELKVPSVSLAYRGTADLARESLPPVTILAPRQPATGWVAISALAREHEIAGYAWLDAYKPVERIGKTIDLYYIR
jgi:4-amino-4-deoxy-L-arabinose transferase-like glycosyltransferase